jgi:hypothetical protein
MQDSHPATCIDCCKRLIDAERKVPEPLEEAGYVMHQLVLFTLYLIGAVLASPLMFTAWLFGSGRKREASSGVEPSFCYVRGGRATPMEMQVLHNQRVIIALLWRKCGSAGPQEKAALLKEIESHQAIHKEYAEKVQRDANARP